MLGDVVVLIVDDDPSSSELAAGLSQNGLQVFRATDRASAIRFKTLYRPQVIIFDVEFCAHQGLQLFRALRDFDHSAHGVLYSATATAVDGFEAHALGVDVVLLKPSPIAHIAQVLRQTVFGVVPADPVETFIAALDTSAERSAPHLSKVVGLLGDVRVGLLPFDCLAGICKSLTAEGPTDRSEIRRRLVELRALQSGLGPHVQDLLLLMASSAQSSDDSHEWPIDIRSEIHSATGRWPHSWYRVARLRSRSFLMDVSR